MLWLSLRLTRQETRHPFLASLPRLLGLARKTNWRNLLLTAGQGPGWQLAFGLLMLLGMASGAWGQDPPVQEDQAAAAAPAKKKVTSKFLRMVRDQTGEPESLQTAIVSFKPAAGNTQYPGSQVDLVGAVHVGDAEYYQKLNDRFKSYEVVLYELVAPEGTRIPKGAKSSSGHPIAAMQNGMKTILGLEHQLEHVDYTAENFVHADMSPEQFADSMTKRDESFFAMYLRVVGANMAAQSRMASRGDGGQLEVLLALFKGKTDVGLKRAFADQFQNMEMMMGAVEGDQGSTIIGERNRVALEGLKEQLEEGKKKIAVFYGAGHLEDMAKRLERDFGMQQVDLTWQEAWDLRDE